MKALQTLPMAILLACTPSCTQHSAGKTPDTVDITIDAGQVRFQMAGGIGASWHAISEDSIDESPDYKWALRIPNSRGSAWGGNPPVTDTDAWDQICRHALWLGFSFISTKKYTCIRWVCITNEPPGGGWGSWWSTGETDAPLTPALKAVREALDRRNTRVPVSGPDWTDLPAFDPAKIDFDPYIGAYDIHSYQGIDEKKQKIVKEWAAWASEHGKPFFLSEIGDMRLGWGKSDPGPKSFAAALSNAESILRGLAVGVGAFNRWSFTNRGDLDGQWQLIRTWDGRTVLLEVPGKSISALTNLKSTHKDPARKLVK